jgi:HPt (histidine-containing phosphotransfer) domain-containing protein
MKGEAEKSIAAGMNQHITKPIDPFILYSALIKHIHRKDVEIRRQESGPLPYTIEGIQLEDGLYRLGNKRPSYEKLLQSYAAIYGNIEEDCAQMIRDNNVKALAAYIHTLSGITGNIGAKEIHARLSPLSASLHHASQQSPVELEPHLLQSLMSLAHDISQLVIRITATFSDKAALTNNQKAIDDKALSEMWSELLVRTANSDSRALDLAEDLLSNYALDMETTFRLKRCLSALENFDFEEAQLHLSA